MAPDLFSCRYGGGGAGLPAARTLRYTGSRLVRPNRYPPLLGARCALVDIAIVTIYDYMLGHDRSREDVTGRLSIYVHGRGREGRGGGTAYIACGSSSRISTARGDEREPMSLLSVG